MKIEMATTHRPSPVAWKMLPLALLILGLGFTGSGYIWRSTEITFLAMNHTDSHHAKSEELDNTNLKSVATKSMKRNGANANVSAATAPVSPDNNQQNLESPVLDDLGIQSRENDSRDGEQYMQKQLVATTSDAVSAPAKDDSESNTGVDADHDSGPDLAEDILAQLSTAMVESDSATESLPTPLTPDEGQDKQNAIDQYADESEDDFIILTLEETPEETKVEAPQVPMFVGEKVQISREMVDAVDSGVLQKVIMLIEQGESIDAVNSLGESALLKASWNGDTELAEKLLELGANLSMAADDGRTPLYSAAVSGNLKLVQLMLELGADVNTSTLNGKTPLMVSAWSDYPEMTHLLLRFGADPDKIDNHGRNAIFYALWDRNIEVVQALLESGADLALVDKQGHSTMDIARLRRIILPGMKVESELQN